MLEIRPTTRFGHVKDESKVESVKQDERELSRPVKLRSLFDL